MIDINKDYTINLKEFKDAIIDEKFDINIDQVLLKMRRHIFNNNINFQADMMTYPDAAKTGQILVT